MGEEGKKQTNKQTMKKIKKNLLTSLKSSLFLLAPGLSLFVLFLSLLSACRGGGGSGSGSGSRGRFGRLGLSL